MKSIGVDVGGTFTDLVYCDMATGASVHKVATTPADPSLGVMAGIARALRRGGRAPSAIDYVFHGTTTATNAVLEHKGARTGMITNEGFRDILQIARHQRVEHYSIMQELPWQNRPLIQRRYRKVVKGRLIPPRGEELEPLDEEAVRRAAVELREEGVDSVAICFLFSYLNPAHETRALEIVREAMPDAFVTTSSAVSPQFREFERFTTTALAAYIGPKVRSYIAARIGAEDPRRDRRPQDHDLERRRRDLSDGVGTAGADAALRTSRRRARRRLGRRAFGPETADHLRHRRHQRRHRHRGRRQIRADRRAIDFDRRLSAVDADDRHPHHRRGRRLDRSISIAAALSASGRAAPARPQARPRMAREGTSPP